MSIVTFLYRYVFRGIGWLLAIGVITGLILWLTQVPKNPATTPRVERRLP
jgi:hypothetical protein